MKESIKLGLVIIITNIVFLLPFSIITLWAANAYPDLHLFIGGVYGFILHPLFKLSDSLAKEAYYDDSAR